MLAEKMTEITNNSAWMDKLGLDHAVSRVLVLGIGKTGLSVARLLAKHHISYALVDTRAAPPALSELRAELPDAPVFLSGLASTAFKVATHLVVSPGVSLLLPEIQMALAAGVRLLSDIDLFHALVDTPVIAITGSNGKSTVTTLVGLMMKHAGLKAPMGGNLGTPALDLIVEGEKPDFYVLELSSFQLERMEHLAPHVAVVLNVSPDHMDRYPDLDAYAQAKARIFANSDAMVINNDDELVRKMAVPSRQVLRFSLASQTESEFRLSSAEGREWLTFGDLRLMPVDEVRIAGRHNTANALAALAVGHLAGVPMEDMLSVLRYFPGLPHRMQWAGDKDGITWVNDSKATNVGATLAALEGLSVPVVLIAGGDGKGADFTPLLPAVRENVRGVVLMGRDAGKLEELFDGVVVIRRTGNMRAAVQAARELAVAGDMVLLSPACASLDQYSSYQARGQAFMDAVQETLA